MGSHRSRYHLGTFGGTYPVACIYLVAQYNTAFDAYKPFSPDTPNMLSFVPLSVKLVVNEDDN